ncbi:hypothetical protein FRB99_000222 [Tulasnella sp. 403]|nr:hypothetical protein FRB99_000222 [Tulasnella sp. 403]
MLSTPPSYSKTLEATLTDVLAPLQDYRIKSSSLSFPISAKTDGGNGRQLGVVQRATFDKRSSAPKDVMVKKICLAGRKDQNLLTMTENILVSDDGVAVLSDVGLGCIAPPPPAIEEKRSSISLKTPPPVPPKDDTPVTLEDDVWSWACAAYEIITGNPPAEGEKGLMANASALEQISALQAVDGADCLPNLLRDCWKVDPSCRPTVAQCLAILSKEDFILNELLAIDTRLVVGNDIRDVQSSRDGGLVALCTWREIDIYDTKTAVRVCEMRDIEDGRCSSPRFSDQRRYLATKSKSHVLYWDLERGQVKEVHTPGSDNLRGLDISPDGSLVAVGTGEGTVHLWYPGQKDKGYILLAQSRILSVAIAPDGRHVAASGGEDAVRIWNVETKALVGVLPAPGVVSLQFASGGQRLVGGGPDESVRYWDVSDLLSKEDEEGESEERELPACKVLNPHKEWVSSIVVSPNGSWVTSTANKGEVSALNVETGRSYAVCRQPNPPYVAMHAVYKLPTEIILLIFENIEIEADVYRAALVCKSSAGGVSGRRKTLYTVQGMSSDHQRHLKHTEINWGDDQTDSRIVSDHLHANDMRVVQRFLRRSQVITSSVADFKLTSWLDRVFKEIAAMDDNRPLWPRLSDLRISMNHINLAICELFVHCPLTSLDVDTEFLPTRDLPPVHKVLVALAPSGQNITDLMIEGGDEGGVDLDSFPKLDTLTMGDFVDGYTWEPLCRCPLLRRIILLPTVCIAGSPDPSVFPSLREFVYLGREAEEVVGGLFDSIRMPELRVARLNLAESGSPDRLEAMHRRLGECPKLHKLSLEFIWFSPYDLSRLNGLSHLRILRLDLLMHVPLADGLLEGLARGLPNLVELQATLSRSGIWERRLFPKIVITAMSLASLSTHYQPILSL